MATKGTTIDTRYFKQVGECTTTFFRSSGYMLEILRTSDNGAVSIMSSPPVASFHLLAKVKEYTEINCDEYTTILAGKAFEMIIL